MTDATEQTPFDIDIAVTLKKLAKHPNMSALDLFRDFLVPLFKDLREEIEDVDGGLAEIQALLPDNEESFIERSERLVASLALMINAVMLKAGFFNDDGSYSASCPPDLKAKILSLGEEVLAFGAEINEVKEALGHDADDDTELTPSEEEAAAPKEPEVVDG